MDGSFLGQAAWNLLGAMVRHAKTLPANVALHLARARILRSVFHGPGKSLAGICDDLALNRGTVAYHLYILERVGAIDSLPRAHTRHFFPPQVEPELQTAFAALRRKRGLEVAAVLLGTPGLEQRELLRRIGMDRKVWAPYRREWAREGLLLEERRGRRIRYHATPKLERLVDVLRSQGRVGLRGMTSPPGAAR